ncbi:hypothetical protein GCM10026983_20490 [Gracilibacillus alcaliphilus]
MNSEIIKTLLFDKQVRLFLTDNTELVRSIVNTNTRQLIAKQALAKAVSGMSLLSASLKDNQRLSAIFMLRTNKLFADTDAQGNVRGYISKRSSFHPEVTSSTIKEWIGNHASIRMIKGFEMQQFTGITEMPYKNIDDDLSYYFR